MCSTSSLLHWNLTRRESRLLTFSEATGMSAIISASRAISWTDSEAKQGITIQSASVHNQHLRNMPNLKSALLNAQHASAQKAAKAKQEQAKLLKQKSITGANKSQNAANKRKAATHTDELGRIVKEKKPSTSTGQVSRAPPVIPYDEDDTILLIGEGNFSYTLSLLSPPHSHPAHLVLATAYDTEAVCYEKYPDAAEHVRQIKERGAGVEFGVDAAQLGRCKAIGKQPRWSRIVFNFPHAGK